MSSLAEKYKDKKLPPMPGAAVQEPEKKPAIEGIPFIVYLNGKPIEMSKKEAMAVMAQIINIMMYLEEQPAEAAPEKKE